MRRKRTIQVLALVLLILAPSTGQAQQSQMRGTWTLNGEQSDDVGTGINTAVARMNVVARQIARARLRNTNTAYPRIVISYDERNVRVEMQDSRPVSVSTPAGGQPVLWERGTGRTCTEVRGDCVRVTTEWENGSLEQTFAAEDGRRVNVYTVGPDGNTLTMDVTVTSPRLPTALTYRLVYTRGS